MVITFLLIGVVPTLLVAIFTLPLNIIVILLLRKKLKNPSDFLKRALLNLSIFCFLIIIIGIVSNFINTYRETESTKRSNQCRGSYPTIIPDKDYDKYTECIKELNRSFVGHQGVDNILSAGRFLTAQPTDCMPPMPFAFDDIKMPQRMSLRVKLFGIRCESH